MSDNLMSRRKFLAGTGLVLGAASVSGVALLKDADPAEAAGEPLAWPYPRAACRSGAAPPRRSRAAPSRSTWVAPARQGLRRGDLVAVRRVPRRHPARTRGARFPPTSSASAPAASPAGVRSAARSTPPRRSSTWPSAPGDGAHRTDPDERHLPVLRRDPAADQRRLEVLSGRPWPRWGLDSDDDAGRHPAARERAVVHRQLAAVPLLARPVDDDDRRGQRRPAAEGPLRQGCFDVAYKLTELLDAYFQAITPSATPSPIATPSTRPSPPAARATRPTPGPRWPAARATTTR